MKDDNLKIDPNLQDVRGNTALHYAVLSSKLDVFVFLLNSFNASSNIMNNRGQLALEINKKKKEKSGFGSKII